MLLCQDCHALDTLFRVPFPKGPTTQKSLEVL
jgi:hypothetical protein